MRNNFHLVSQLLRGVWLIEPGFAQAALPQVERILKGESAQANDNGNEPKPETFLAVAQGGSQVQSFDNAGTAPKGAIAVIDIAGPTMKYDSCAAEGTMSMAAKITAAANHPNISAIILRADTPGGQVFGTDTLAEAVATAAVPVLTWVNDGLLASAGVWGTVASDEIYASRVTDKIGSIGVFQTLVDRTGQYEQMGISVQEIYADDSEEKNLPYRKLAEGDNSLIKADLKFIRDQFVATVQNYRPQVKEAALHGAVYNAPEAIEMGLIDGILSWEQVINRANELAGTSQSKQQTTTDKTEMFNRFRKVSALAGAEEITEASLAAANQELHSAGITSAVLVEAGALEAIEREASHSEAELIQANEKVTELEQSNSDLTAQLEAANEQIATLKNEPAIDPKAGLTQEGDDKIEGSTPAVALSSWEKKAQRRAKN